MKGLTWCLGFTVLTVRLIWHLRILRSLISSLLAVIIFFKWQLQCKYVDLFHVSLVDSTGIVVYVPHLTRTEAAFWQAVKMCSKETCPSRRGRQGHTPPFSLPYTLKTRRQKQKRWEWDETTTSFYTWHHTASFSCHSLYQRSGQSNISFQCGGLVAKSCPTLVTHGL